MISQNFYIFFAIDTEGPHMWISIYYHTGGQILQLNACRNLFSLLTRFIQHFTNSDLQNEYQAIL